MTTERVSVASVPVSRDTGALDTEAPEHLTKRPAYADIVLDEMIMLSLATLYLSLDRRAAGHMGWPGG